MEPINPNPKVRLPEKTGIFENWLSKARDVVTHDPAEAKRCIEEAERGAADDFDRVKVAEAWMALLHDADRAKAIFPAPNKTERPMTQIFKIQEYHKMFGGNVNPVVRERLAQIEGEITYVHHFCEVAQIWIHILGPKPSPEFRRCMGLAEERVKTSHDWIWCATSWRQIKDVANDARCLQNAETLAKDWVDWSGCAVEWHYLDPERYRESIMRCLRRAEPLCKLTRDRLFLADEWVNLANEKHYARLLPLAEGLAVTKEDWRSIADSWLKECGDREGFDRCMNRAGDGPPKADRSRDPKTDGCQ